MNFTQPLRASIRRYSTAIVITVVFVAGFALGNQHAIGAAQSQFAPPPDAEELFVPFWQVYNLIQNDYVDPEDDPVDPTRLVDGAIAGMVDALGDENSGYMDPEIFPSINRELEGNFEGIGVVIHTLEDTGEIQVVSVLSGSPAESVGIQPGDIFVRVDGEEVSAMTQVEMGSKVRGPEGTQVQLTMRRGDELLDFTVTRARLVVPNIETRMLDGNIGYIRLTQFSPQARMDIDKALADLHAESLDGLVLDLRGNPGGLLNTAVDVASAFIEQGTIVIEDFGDGNEQVFSATGNYSGVDAPMVVLVDEGSASASELIAGAMQDHDRATIIGETTFGKGTVQTWQTLVNGGGVRLTIARWLTPDRNWIHALGITPDIVVDWDPDPVTLDDPDTTDPQLDAALQFLESAADTSATVNNINVLGQ